MAQAKIRLVKVRNANDYLAVGSSLFLMDDLSGIWWSKEFGRVVVKIKCHPDAIGTDVTDRADWDAYLGGLT